MTDPRRTGTPYATGANDLEQDPELGYTLQDMVLESPDVEDFLTNFAVLMAGKMTTESNEVICGVTVVRRKRGVTAASSDERAEEMDRLQNTFGGGPCLTALEHRSTVYVPNTGSESRWPDYTNVAAAHGIGSILAIALDLAGEAEAVVNLYSSRTYGFSVADIEVAEGFADHAATSLHLAIRIAQLRNARDDLSTAMQSRTTIDMAVGIIMAQNRCGRDEAFAVLSKASSHRNVKIRDVAASIVASVSGEEQVTTYFDE